MKILVISTIDNRGGAASVAWELRRRLKTEGHTVNTFVRYKYSGEADVHVILRKRYQDWLVKLFADDTRFARTEYIFDTKEYKEADIIHYHNLHSNFFNLRNIERMSREKPVIWTLHDMWAFTGFPYNSYTLRHPNKKRFLLCLWDNTSRLLTVKKEIYKRSKLWIVTVSEWLKKQAQNSILTEQHLYRIHNGIDVETFRPRDKQNARASLGLPLSKKIVGCGIKGWKDSKKIIDSYLGNDDIFFVSIGDDHIKTENKNFAVLPRTEDIDTIASYLSALDVFLHPTPEDSFGLIPVEAMSCGVPVVAYGIDALPETVIHKETGYIAQYENIGEMKAGMEYVLNLPKAEYEKMSDRARERVYGYFSSERMYKEYLDLYQRVLSTKTDERKRE